MKLRRLVCLAICAILLFNGCTSTNQIKDSIENLAEGTSSSTTMEAVYITVNGKAVMIPAYKGQQVIEINDNEPFFKEADLTTEPFEEYSELDKLNRAGVAYANICKELMPTESRGEIGQIKPSGWHTVKYDCIDGNYLYNRCHLIGFQLAGENANELNLVTGTRSFNVDGMLPYENMVDDYVEETGNHVLYRVTPAYVGSNLLCNGVLMEAKSVEDDGLQFNVFVYNVQSGVVIDYATGESHLEGVSEETEKPQYTANEEGIVYILNTNSKKYHLETCSSVSKISDSNRESFNGTIEWLSDNGYEPCGICKPNEK